MTFTHAETTYLASQRLHMAASQKFRNVRRTGRAALAVDDIASLDSWRARLR